MPANRNVDTLTFLFTDIEGSTRLWEQHPDAMRDALERHDNLLRVAIEGHGGRVFKTVGDAFCAVFSDAPAALESALAMQYALEAEPWTTTGPLRVRVALHTGAAEARDRDFFGPALNRVARLLSAGHGGQVLVSQSAVDRLAAKAEQAFELRDMGMRRLKDLTCPEHVYQVVAPNLPAEFPPLRTLDMRPNNLPTLPTTFIGRDVLLLAAREELARPDVHLLTLTGAGGTGKTRLALQLAAELIDEFEHGVFYVALSSIRDSSRIASTIARALGLNETPGESLRAGLENHLHDKDLLLVLDNFEHLVSAATVVSALIAAAPRLKVLVTSRALLLLYGEHDFPVPPLHLPDPERLPPLSDLKRIESVQLFVDRATSLQPGFTLTEDNSPAVAEICVRLDGLPLAIELAASRVRHLSPQAIQARLGRRLAILTGGGRDRQEKHQTLRAAIDWSYDLLDSGEQVLFARLAVFTGGSTLQAAEAVCDVDGALATDVLDGMGSLLDNSLLRLDQQAEGEHRYGMLRTIHEYASDRLEASGDLAALRRAHAHFFLQLVEEAEDELTGADEVAWFNRLETEHGNLRSALKWSATVGGESTWGLRLCRVLWRFWHTHGHYEESCDWLDWARAGLEGVDDATLRADIVYRAGSSHMILGDMDEGAALVLEALQLFRALEDEQGTSWALNDLAFVAVQQGDLALAKERYEQSLVLKLQRGDRWDAARTMINLGQLAWRQGDFEQAVRHYEDVLALHEEQQPLEMEARAGVLGNYGEALRYLGRHARSLELYREGIQLNQRIGNRQMVAMCLYGMADLASMAGSPRHAARLLGAARQIYADIGFVLDVANQQDFDNVCDGVRSQLDEATWRETRMEGQSWTVEKAVATALAGPADDERAS